jgi:hypothetical protein
MRKVRPKRAGQLTRAQRAAIRRTAWLQAQAAPFTERRHLYERLRDAMLADAHEGEGAPLL